MDERDINNLEDAATTADDYALTHRLSVNNMSGPNKFNHNQYHKGYSNRPNKDKSSQNQNSSKEGKTAVRFLKSGI